MSDVLADNGDIVAHYEYAPFGAVIAQRGVSAAANPWRFSIEYAEDDIATVYYNYRHYEAAMGRWMNRDPIMYKGMSCMSPEAANSAIERFINDADSAAEECKKCNAELDKEGGSHGH